MWPRSSQELEQLQQTLAERYHNESIWQPPTNRPVRVGAVFVAPVRSVAGPSAAEDAWAAAVVVVAGQIAESVITSGQFDAPYTAGLLALREGRLLQAAIAGLAESPDVVLVNATGRDHPRRAGLAIHLGAACGSPTIGVTDRPLLARAEVPAQEPGSATELILGGELVGYALRMHADTRSVMVHSGWRVDPPTARAIVLAVRGRGRTPEPLREARRLARTARASAQGH